MFNITTVSQLQIAGFYLTAILPQTWPSWLAGRHMMWYLSFCCHWQHFQLKIWHQQTHYFQKFWHQKTKIHIFHAKIYQFAIFTPKNGACDKYQVCWLAEKWEVIRLWGKGALWKGLHAYNWCLRSHPRMFNMSHPVNCTLSQTFFER